MQMACANGVYMCGPLIELSGVAHRDYKRIEGASMIKFGNATIGGQIQVPDVHSFTMSQTKKVVLDGFFYFLNCFFP